MSNEEFLTIQQSDGYLTSLYPHYSKSKDLNGSVVLFHGIAEHHKRYHIFADFLNEQCYDVYLYDHRGHGTDKKLSELGFVADQGGYALLIKDGIEVLKYVKKNMRTKTLILFAHSMGSLVGRNVIQYYHELDAAIFCGTAYPSKLTSVFGILTSSMIAKFKGPRYLSALLTKAMFGSKLYTNLCKRTTFDWLTRSNPVVETYMQDPYCGFICSTAFYRDIVHLSYYASQKRRIMKAQKDLPILFISGSKDPVGGYGKNVINLFERFKHYGFIKVSCNIYEDCRHELLNELNGSTIMDNITSWLHNQTDQP